MGLRFVGVGVTFAVLLFLPVSVHAVELDGVLAWSDHARVEGNMAAGYDGPAYLLQSVAAGAPAGHAWTMTASDLLVEASWRHERNQVFQVAQDPNALISTTPEAWENQSYQYEAAHLRITLRPAQHDGIGLLYTTPGHRAEFHLAPIGGEAYRVRPVSLGGTVAAIPASAQPGEEGHAYEVPLEGTLLEVTGRFESFAVGDLDGLLFGWDVEVSSPGHDVRVFHTGITPTYDPKTGLETGHRIEYVRLRAMQAAARQEPQTEDLVLYTPLLRYIGQASFPAGTYEGRAQHWAPSGAEARGLLVPGDIWMTVADPQSGDREGVRVWGDAGWALPGGTTPSVVPTPSTNPFVLVAAIGLFAAGQLVEAALRALRAPLLAFYARLREQNLEDNETRLRIVQLVSTEPGLNLTEIVHHLGIGWGTAAYHTQVLKQRNHLKEVRFLNRVCFFLPGEVNGPQQLQRVLLRQSNYETVLRVLRETPGLSQREIADRTGHARQYISRLVAKMETVGLLRTDPSSMGRRYYPVLSPPASAALPLPNGNAPVRLTPLVAHAEHPEPVLPL